MGVFVRALTELEFGGFGQGLPPPGPLEHTQTHTLVFCFWQASLFPIYLGRVGNNKLFCCPREVMGTTSKKKKKKTK